MAIKSGQLKERADYQALLLENDEKKRELMQVFLEDIYKNLKGVNI